MKENVGVTMKEHFGITMKCFREYEHLSNTNKFTTKQTITERKVDSIGLKLTISVSLNQCHDWRGALYSHPQRAAEKLCGTASPHRSHTDRRTQGAYAREADEHKHDKTVILPINYAL